MHVFSYKYDDQNRLKSIKINNRPYVEYTYDWAGQLSQIEDLKNNTKTIYKYDLAGNITEKMKLSEGEKWKIDQYKYDDKNWKDRLTKFNEDEIKYDNVGNPIKYGDMSLSWISGRQLETVNNDNQYIEYMYDENGLRQNKTIYKTKGNYPIYTYRYFWNYGTLVGYDIYNHKSNKLDTVTFIIDDEKITHGFIVNDTEIYVYEKNANDDIIGIYNNGDKIAEYTYGSFGELISIVENSEAALFNILFYRGYCYDRETDMYYLKSRYYMPEWGRFLNADTYVDTGTGIFGTNMFAYCENDPINFVDPDGYWKKRGSTDSHEKLTRILYDGENFSLLEDMIDANVWIDETYDATTRSYQKYHFDRINYTSGSTDDTRVEMAGYWLGEAVKCAQNSLWEAKYIGRAMHSLQDYSSHGNVGINHWMAVHGANADKQNYIWKDNVLRGSNELPGFSGIKKTTGTQHRWIEAQEMSAATILLYVILRVTAQL